jgi:hypothetical protein
MTFAPASRSTSTTAAPTPFVPPVKRARQFKIEAHGMISRLAILPCSSRKKKRRSTGLPGKISGQPARDDSHATFLLQAERITCVCELGGRFVLPLLDGCEAGVGMAFFFHDGGLRKTPRNGFAVEFVGGATAASEKAKAAPRKRDSPRMRVSRSIMRKARLISSKKLIYFGESLGSGVAVQMRPSARRGF